jgi:hypothetical protein
MTLSRRPQPGYGPPHGDGDGETEWRVEPQAKFATTLLAAQFRDVRKRERSGASIIVYLNFELVAVQDGVVACCRNSERTIG